jgi:ketosteroid isomerase-like protein
MVLLLGVEIKMASARQRTRSDEGGHILALDNSWNRALETKDTKALDLLLADTFVSVDIDGSMETKRQFLTGVKAPDYHPSQAVTEQSTVEVYGDSAVVVGVRSKGADKGRSTTMSKPGTVNRSKPGTGTCERIGIIANLLISSVAPASAEEKQGRLAEVEPPFLGRLNPESSS